MRSAFIRPVGFTLLEVLIAIFITAAIGLGSWQVLNQAIRTNELTQTGLAELGDLQKMMFFVSRDMQQVAARSIRDEFGDYQPALSTKNDEFIVEFTRVGWRNPLPTYDVRSEVQRVAYELNADGDFSRFTWSVLDRAQDSEPRSRILMSELSEVNVSFLSQTDEWIDDWPPVSGVAGASADPMAPFNTLPRAINLTFTSDRFGEMNRVYDFVSYQEQQDIPGAAGGAGGVGGAGGSSGAGNGSNNEGAGGADDEDVGEESVEQIR